MLELFKPVNFADEITLNSIDFLENYSWRQENTATTDNDKCVYYLAVNDFAPEEIKVKTTDSSIIVEGQHEERQDEQGYISRQFRRKYKLPVGCLLDKVTSTLSPNGTLVITIPKQQFLEQNTVIPVSHDKAKSKL